MNLLICKTLEMRVCVLFTVFIYIDFFYFPWPSPDRFWYHLIYKNPGNAPGSCIFSLQSGSDTFWK